jgi:hypothetical protein
MSDESVDFGREVPQSCQDCGCRPHRHANPSRDKTCDCGCPDLRVAKRERDDYTAGSKADNNRNTSPGFY